MAAPLKKRSYNTVSKNLESWGFKIDINVEEFSSTNNVIFVCENEHKNIMNIYSFENKKRKLKKDEIDMKAMCTECVKQDEAKDLFDRDYEFVLEHTGHKLLKRISAHDIEYECGNCGAVRESDMSSLRKSTSKCCSKCQNDKNKRQFDDVKTQIQNLGFVLKTYIDNKHMTAVCPCGNETEFILADIMRKRRCLQCQPDRILEFRAAKIKAAYSN